MDVDERQANAVAARIELDLRIGAALTRLQTLSLQTMGPELAEQMLSYGQQLRMSCIPFTDIPAGSCQFPTLGFVVDRYFRVRNFVPETFWKIEVTHLRDNITVRFSWDRYHLFDRMAAVILYERCLLARKAKITKIENKPTSRWRPLPLTTLQMQQMATQYLRMDSQQAMNVMIPICI